MSKLKSKLSEQDWAFVRQLTELASVNVEAQRVTMTIPAGKYEGLNIAQDEKLTFPRNWSLLKLGMVSTKGKAPHLIKMCWQVWPDSAPGDQKIKHKVSSMF